MRLFFILVLAIFLAVFIFWIGFIGPGVNGYEFGRGSGGCPAECAWLHPVWFKYLRPPFSTKISGGDIFYTVLVFVESLLLIFCIWSSIGPYLQKKAQKRCTAETSALVLLLFSWLLGTIVMIIDRGPGRRVEGSESEFGFGQVLPLALTVLPFWQAVASFSDM